MRGLVTLAAALALPADFPFRDLIVFTAFAVVLGTRVFQGLTLKPLLLALDLRDDDPVGQEVGRAREQALGAALETFENDMSTVAESVRQTVFEMWAGEDIGEDAFHVLEEEFDWIEMCRGDEADRS